MISNLVQKGVKKVIASDINFSRYEEAQKLFAGYPVEVRRVPYGDSEILFENVDIVSPCALGGILNENTIPKLRAKIICGECPHFGSPLLFSINQVLACSINDICTTNHRHHKKNQKKKDTLAKTS